MKKKILFWIYGDITSFAIPHYLSEKIDFEAFAIMDVTNKPKKFYQEQKLTQFKKFWFYHDFFKSVDFIPDIDYLEKFEKKYNINLWELATNERIFYRFNKFHTFDKNEILKILETECKKFEEIIDEIKPDYYVSLDPNFHHSELLFRLLRHIGVKTLIVNQPNFKKTIISQEPRKLDYCDLNSVSSSNQTFEQLRNELKKYNIFEHGVKQRDFFKTSKKDLFNSALYYIFRYENMNIRTHYTYFGRTKFKVLVDNLKNLFLKSRRKKYIDKNLKKEKKLDQKFIYFPLGVDEERNLLLSAPFFTNQIEIIRSIAKSIPTGYTIIVKENPSQSIRYWRSISEYNEIQRIPNVELLHPSFPNEKLMKNCSLLITISGSAGFEASFYGKPSIIFSDLGYNILSSVTQVKSILELSSAIRNSLNKKIESDDLDKYLKLLEKQSVNFDVAQIQANYHKFFYYGGWIIDVNIPEQKMKLFLDENKPLFSEVITKLSDKILNLN